MNFEIETSALLSSLESMQMKGKYVTVSGFSSSSLGESVLSYVDEGSLHFMNGDATTMAKLSVEIEEVEESNSNPFCFMFKEIMPFLKSFNGNLRLVIEQAQLEISTEDDTNIVKIPLIQTPDNLQTIYSMRTMLSQFNSYSRIEDIINSEELPMFNKTQLESASLFNNVEFTKALKTCELIGTGIFELTIEQNAGIFNIRSTLPNKEYTHTMQDEQILVGEASVSFTSPLYSFFDKTSDLILLSKDDSPIILVAEDRVLLRAPRVRGD